jgi:hypothetical protein
VCLAQRFNTNFDYNSNKMKITNRPDVDAFIKEPAREGWSYGSKF